MTSSHSSIGSAETLQKIAQQLSYDQLALSLFEWDAFSFEENGEALSDAHLNYMRSYDEDNNKVVDLSGWWELSCRKPRDAWRYALKPNTFNLEKLLTQSNPLALMFACVQTLIKRAHKLSKIRLCSNIPHSLRIENFDKLSSELQEQLLIWLEDLPHFEKIDIISATPAVVAKMYAVENRNTLLAYYQRKTDLDLGRETNLWQACIDAWLKTLWMSVSMSGGSVEEGDVLQYFGAQPLVSFSLLSMGAQFLDKAFAHINASQPAALPYNVLSLAFKNPTWGRISQYIITMSGGPVWSYRAYSEDKLNQLKQNFFHSSYLNILKKHILTSRFENMMLELAGNSPAQLIKDVTDFIPSLTSPALTEIQFSTNISCDILITPNMPLKAPIVLSSATVVCSPEGLFAISDPYVRKADQLQIDEHKVNMFHLWTELKGEYQSCMQAVTLSPEKRKIIYEFTGHEGAEQADIIFSVQAVSDLSLSKFRLHKPTYWLGRDDGLYYVSGISTAKAKLISWIPGRGAALLLAKLGLKDGCYDHKLSPASGDQIKFLEFAGYKPQVNQQQLAVAEKQWVALAKKHKIKTFVHFSGFSLTELDNVIARNRREYNKSLTLTKLSVSSPLEEKPKEVSSAKIRPCKINAKIALSNLQRHVQIENQQAVSQQQQQQQQQEEQKQLQQQNAILSFRGTIEEDGLLLCNKFPALKTVLILLPDSFGKSTKEWNLINSHLIRSNYIVRSDTISYVCKYSSGDVRSEMVSLKKGTLSDLRAELTELEEVKEIKASVMTDKQKKIITERTGHKILPFFSSDEINQLSQRYCEYSVGKNDSFLFPANITWMTKSAAYEFNRTQNFLLCSLKLDNLPGGYFLQMTKSGEVVLDYDREGLVENKKTSPLTIKVPKMRSAPVLFGDARQFGIEDKSLPWVITANESEESPEQHWNKLTECMLAEDPVLASELIAIHGDLLQELTKPRELESSSKCISGFWSLFVEKGCSTDLFKLLESLQRLRRSHGDKYFKEFESHFLDTNDNWLSLICEDVLTSIDKLAALDSNQLIWWRYLSAQHALVADIVWLRYLGAHGLMRMKKQINLPDLLNGFLYFNQEFQQLTGRALPDQCSFDSQLVGGKSCYQHMNVILDRLLDILKHAKQLGRLEEQLDNMLGLSLGPEGAWYAIRNFGYYFITLDMRIGQGFSHWGAYTTNLDFFYEVDYQGLKKFALAQSHIEVMRIYFYRYLGRQAYIAPLNHYQLVLKKFIAHVKALEKEKKASSITHQALLALLAFSSTHPRGVAEDILSVDVVPLIAAEPEALICLLDYDELDTKITFNEAVSLAKFLGSSSSEKIRILEINQDTRQFIQTCKEKFLTAITMLNQSQYGLKAVDFLTILKMYQGDDPAIQGSIAKILAIAGHSNIQTKDGEAFLAAIEHLQQRGNAAIFQLQDIVERIDLKHFHSLRKNSNNPEKATDLFSLDKLTQFLQAMAKFEHVDNYVELIEFVKQQLPGVVFKEKSLSTFEFDLNDILQSAQDEIAKIFKEKLGIYLDSGKLKDPAYLIKIAASRSVIDLMSVVPSIFKLLNAMSSILLAKEIKTCLPGISIKNKKIIEKMVRLQFGLMKDMAPSLDFLKGDFSKLDPSRDCKIISPWLYVLARVQNQWPESLSIVLEILSDESNSKVGKFPLTIEVICQILESISIACRNTDRFPKGILSSIVCHRDISRVSDVRLMSALNGVLKNDVLSLLAKDRMLRIAVTKAVTASPDFMIEDLLRWSTVYPSVFLSILSMLELQNSDQIDDAFNSIRRTLVVSSNFSVKQHQRLIENLLAIAIKHPRKYNQLSRSILVVENAEILLILGLSLTEKQSAAEVAELVNKLNALDESLLMDLAKLYAKRPYPTIEILKKHLSQNSIPKLISDFPSNPYGNRTKKVLKKQFDTKRVNDAINGIVDLTYDDGRPLSSVQRARLHQWFNFVNELGHNKDYPIYTTFAADGRVLKKSAKDLSAEEILLLVNKIRDILQNPTQAISQKITAQLCFLAIAREVIYQSIGNFPNSTQIIAVLNDLMQGGHVLSELCTGEGKSIISAIIASRLAIEPQVVDDCTSNDVLAKRGNDEFFDYYDTLGLVHSEKNVTVNSRPSDYNSSAGVNYSDVANLAIFRECNQIEGDHIEVKKASLVLDEVDFSTLYDGTQYRYAKNLEVKGDASVTPFAWIYPFVNEFIQSDQYKAHVSQEEDVKNLLRFLLKNATTPFQKHVAERLFDPKYAKQIDAWIDAAVAAAGLEEKTHFVVKTVKNGKDEAATENSCAKILINSRVSQDAQWSNGVHQFLHARLEKFRLLKPDAESIPPFKIEPEIAPLASASCKNFIDYYRKRGRIVGLSATVGAFSERREQHEKGLYKIFRVPPHQKNIRIDRNPILAIDESHQLEMIKKAILQRLRQQHRYWWQRDRKPQPIMIICKDVKKSERIYAYLERGLAEYRQYSAHLQLYNGEQVKVNGQLYVKDPHDTRGDESIVVDQAGISGWITVTTPLLGRGTDVKPRLEAEDIEQNHPDGLCVFQTDVLSESEMKQGYGRSGRLGHAGETLSIINQQELYGKTINEVSEDITRQLAQERQYRDRQCDIKNCFFHRFLRLLNAVPGDADGLKKNILTLWKDYLEEIDRRWLKLSQEVQLHNDLSNAEKLALCSRDYMQYVTDRWEGFLSVVPSILENHQFKLVKNLDLSLSVLALQQEVSELPYARDISQPTQMNFNALPFFKMGIKRTYAVFNPDNLFRDDAVEEPIKDKVIAILSEYETYKLPKADDRIANFTHLVSGLRNISNNADSVEILRLLNTARSAAMKSDWRSDSMSFFFMRNWRGSRYQDLLESARQCVLSQCKAENADALLALEFEHLRDILMRISERMAVDIQYVEIGSHLNLDTSIRLLADIHVSSADKYAHLYKLMDNFSKQKNAIQSISNHAIRNLISVAQSANYDLLQFFEEGKSLQFDGSKKDGAESQITMCRMNSSLS